LTHHQPQAGLWFCPTIYCGRFAEHRVRENRYLIEIGEGLEPDIEVLWTGPEIIPETIPVDSIREISAILGRPPLIWDNLHANDYDLRRMFLGPFAGRPIELRAVVRGILSNPNCEFEANFIPLHTLGSYVQATSVWDVDQALEHCCRQWLPAFSCRTGREFTLEDLRLLVNLFHLPFGAGPRAEELIGDFDFLIHHPTPDWGEHWVRFQQTADAIALLFVKITELADRELCFTFYRLMWEIQAELKLMRGYLNLLREPSPATRHYTPKIHHDPRIYRGGVVARLQRLMPMDGPGEFRAS
ncbi:MAG TPA: beta-N-acetylglucosaminidase domain-containing protein, partial [Chloroflexota bacterium]|nr:beta-N-acetylglucosaminidase domain-containing protein [Chloroflexota bacterium]